MIKERKFNLVGSIKAVDSRQHTAYREKLFTRLPSTVYGLLFFTWLLATGDCRLLMFSPAQAASPTLLPSRLINFYTPIKENLVDEKAVEEWLEAGNLESARSLIKEALNKAQSDTDKINIRRLWARMLVKASEPGKALAEYEAVKREYPIRILGPNNLVLYSPAQLQWEIAQIEREQGKGHEVIVQTAKDILPANSDDAGLVTEIKLYADMLRDQENSQAVVLYQLLLQYAPNVKAEVSWGDTVGREAQAGLTYIKSDKSFAVKEKENLVKILTGALQNKDLAALEKYASKGYFYTGFYGADVQRLSSFDNIKEKIRRSFVQAPAKFTRQTMAAPGKTYIHTNNWQGLDSETIVLMIVKTRYGWEWRGWMYY